MANFSSSLGNGRAISKKPDLLQQPCGGVPSPADEEEQRLSRSLKMRLNNVPKRHSHFPARRPFFL